MTPSPDSATRGQKQALRWLVRVRSGDFIPNSEIEKEPSDITPIPVIGGNGIMAFTNKTNTKRNTLIVGRVGALCGNVHLTQEDAWITDNALIISLITRHISPRYLFEVLAIARLNDKASKSAQPLITGETVKSLKLVVPDTAIQDRICDEIASIRYSAKGLSEVVGHSIIRLREFRSALITSAATGQIDVATWNKRGSTDRRLDFIEAEMGAAQPIRRHARA